MTTSSDEQIEELTKLLYDAESRPPLDLGNGVSIPVDVEASVRTGWLTYGPLSEREKDMPLELEAGETSS